MRGPGQIMNEYTFLKNKLQRTDHDEDQGANGWRGVNKRVNRKEVECKAVMWSCSLCSTVLYRPTQIQYILHSAHVTCIFIN